MVGLWERLKTNSSVRRTIVLCIIFLCLYLIRNIISLILLTFILTYLIIRGVEGIHHLTKLPKKLIAIVMYLLIIVFLYFSITVYVPKLFNQTIQMIEEVFNFYQKADTNNKLYEWIAQNVGFNEIKQQLTTGAKVVFTTITSIGSMGITFVMSLILSFFFIIEKDWVTEFGQAFFKSKIGLFSQDVAYLGKKFVNTFGVVIEAQFNISTQKTI